MGDATHFWEKQDLLAHTNAWQAETDAGRKGVQEHNNKRMAGRA